MPRCSHVLSYVIALTVMVAAPSPASAVPALRCDTVASGLSIPVFVTAPAGDSSRVFIVELPGTIRIVKNGMLLTEPFLDITDLTCDESENGLLGLAFHPNYAANGYFYVYYTDNDCNVQISRFSVSGINPDSADKASESGILNIDQPDFPNHNGGSILFGPDGYLYIPTGDGTCCGDPFGNAQNPMVLQGKLLRIDIDGGSPYAIPPTNPYFGSLSVANEILALGLRNPYRCAFDRGTGDLYLADVGQDTWEEVSFVDSADLAMARNLGWPEIEGRHCYNPPFGCNFSGHQLPIHEFLHDEGRCSITGGSVYRGCAIPELFGRYLFGDFCTGEIWSLTHDGFDTTTFFDHTPDIGTGFFDLTAIAEDASGEMYVCTYSGAVCKIVPQGPPASCTPSCACACQGDADCDGDQDVVDVVLAVNIAFRGAAPLCDNDCEAERTDLNCDGVTGIVDVVKMTNVAFRGADPAVEFCDACVTPPPSGSTCN